VSTLVVKGLPKLFEPQPAANGGKQAAGVAARTNPRVLFAEDTRFFRDHVTRLLGGAGFEVTAVADGQLAWDRFSADGQAFDIVLTDVQMPNCDGLELTRRIRSAGKRDLPIVALTSLSSDEDKSKGNAAGVNEYLVKLDDAALIRALRRHTGVET
jgi:two-component system chemotaxis sensor kinase CheA